MLILTHIKFEFVLTDNSERDFPGSAIAILSSNNRSKEIPRDEFTASMRIVLICSLNNVIASSLLV
jgi:hypothetical protein